MRCLASALFAAVFALLPGVVARASDRGPVIVVPGRVGVPVMIDGVDVSGAVVYGDWGLARPGHGRIIIEGPVGYEGPVRSGTYYPSAGHAPRYGRHEIEPPRRSQRPSTDYSRSWSAGSDTAEPVTDYPPFNPPAVIMAPPPRRR
jgi:hypothetical protein